MVPYHPLILTKPPQRLHLRYERAVGIVRRLRSLIFNAIEKIEVAVRTKIVQFYAEYTALSFKNFKTSQKSG